MPSKGSEKDKKATAGRDPVTGRFVKGYGGGGRKALPEDLKEAFREVSWDALDVLKKILKDEDAKHSDRIKCAEIILDRGYGKPVQAVDLEHSAGGEVGVVLLPARTDG